MVEKLNEKTVERLAAPEAGNVVHYFAGQTLQGLVAPRGFGVRVTAAGAKAFILNYRIAGRERRYTIGTWPDWPVIRAVKTARELRRRIDQGTDPLTEREAARESAVTGRTVSDVLDEHLDRYVRKNALRSAREIEQIFMRHVRPRIGATGIYALRRADIVAMLDEIEDGSGPVMADRTLAHVRKAFNWLATRDDQFNSPIVKGMARVRPRERARARILADDEIRDLWAALDTIEGPFPRIVRTLLLTAQRRSEVALMQWGEIDGDTWIIPAERYKTGFANAVPLSAAVRGIIGTRPDKVGPFVFSTTKGEKAFSGFSKARRDLDAAIAAARKKAGREPLPAWVLHDLRRTARSLMSRAGVDSDVAERVLGHAIPGIRAVYDRHSFAAEKRGALDKLAALVKAILGGGGAVRIRGATNG